MPRTHYTYSKDEMIIWMFEHGYSIWRTAIACNVSIYTIKNWFFRHETVPDTIGLLLAYIDLYGEWNGPARPRRKASRDRAKMTPRPKLWHKGGTRRKKCKFPSDYKPMDYYEFNSWRGRLHLSGTQAAKHLRVNPHTMLRWQCNRSRIPSWVRRACNYIERYGPLDEFNQPAWAHWVMSSRLATLATGDDHDTRD